MSPWDELGSEAREGHLRELARAGLESWELPAPELSLLQYDDGNATYRVDAGSERFALRVTAPISRHPVSDIRAEIAWLEHVRTRGGPPVPEPVPTPDGRRIVEAEWAPVPESRPCVLFRWLPGDELEERLTPESAHAFGAASAELHRAAESFVPPPDFRVRIADRVLPYANEDFPPIEPAVPPEDPAFPGDAATRRVYRQAFDRIQATLDRLFTAAKPRIIHFDPHPGNAKIDGGRIRWLDFEEICWGFPAQDAAVSVYYLGLEDGGERLQAAFREGYRAVSPWPVASEEDLRTLMMARAVLLVNYVLASDEPEHREMAVEYVERVRGRLEGLSGA